MTGKRFVYFQPNEKDLKDKYGDCTIRALCKIFECTWLDAFRKTLPLCEQHQLMPSYMFFAGHEDEMAEMLGLKRNSISVKKGQKRPTVDEFAKSHPQGRFIVKVAHHVVAVVDGKYYDTWDSGKKPLYGYYELIK